MPSMSLPIRRSRLARQHALEYREPPNREDSKCRAQREDRKRPPPAKQLDLRWHQLDGDRREEKTERGLESERGPDCMGGDRFGDERAELGRIGDDEEAPEADDDGEKPARAAKDQRHQECASAARR